MNISKLENIYKENENSYIEQLIEFLKFKSISAKSEHEQDCRDCTTWLIKELADIGLKTELLETGGKPVVYGEFLTNPDNKTILIYGHYDVQPAVIEDGWDHDPFIPEIRDGQIYARGAVDNKGQIFYCLKAVETYIKEGKAENNIKVIIEGGEEIGSEDLAKMIPTWKDKLKADTLIVCDSGMIAEGSPAVEAGMRGVGSLNFTLYGPKQDVHSGSFGGLIKNPAQELIRMLSKLHNEDGSIAVPNYYDLIPDISEEEKIAIESIPFSEEDLLSYTGLPATGGEIELSPIERNGLRPTIEISGVQSGYNGEGSKTIVPATAHCNITLRFARGQDGKLSISQIKKFLEENCPEEMKIECIHEEYGCDGFQISSNSKSITLAKEVFKEIFNKDTIVNYHGATIPIIPLLIENCAPEAVVTGTALETDGWHSPNEHFGLDRIAQGFIFITLFLSRYGK